MRFNTQNNKKAAYETIAKHVYLGSVDVTVRRLTDAEQLASFQPTVQVAAAQLPAQNILLIFKKTTFSQI